ncbi:hypothetical protein N0Y54_04710 [Nostoc punctiforme UO1]|uniref:hypothetical protein n=1 Tax=Nostoc punctiforme TaxID=272131 RepID=UPI00309EA68B
MSFIIFVLNNPGKVGYQITYLVKSPELFVILTILLILSPIPTISFPHHLLHLLISRFVSEIQAPEIGRIKGAIFQPKLCNRSTKNHRVSEKYHLRSEKCRRWQVMRSHLKAKLEKAVHRRSPS